MTALELLAPARTADIGIAAVDCGADAVYIAGPAFGARKDAGNPIEEVGRLCAYAHKFGVRIFMTVNILAVGDVCGRPGLDFLRRSLRAVQKTWHIDFTVVNGENANVVGVTPAQCEEIFAAGADVITLGNHTWTRTEMQDYLARSSRCLRPANYAPQCPGQGFGVYETSFGRVCVVNAMGRFTLDSNTDNPFVVVDNILAVGGFALEFSFVGIVDKECADAREQERDDAYKPVFLDKPAHITS